MKKSLRTTIITLLILFALVATLFLWEESLSSQWKVNDQKLADFFSIIGALTTSLTIFLLYRQIQEMQEDRKASNKPDLYPETTHLTIILLSGFYDNDLLEIMPILTDVAKDEMIPAYLNIYNIGLGTAKEISFDWIYDKIEIEKIISSKYHYSDNQIAPKQHHNFLLAEKNLRIDPPFFYLKCCGRDFNKKETPIKELIDFVSSPGSWPLGVRENSLT